jgi:hypothetical protein
VAVPALDYSRLPAFGLPAPDDDKTKNKGVLGPGLKAGLRDLESVLGSAVQGGGKLFGSDSVAAVGKDINDSASAASAAAGRPDLEIAPWREGGGSVLPWLGYQAAKQVPMLAAYLAGGKAYGLAGGEAPAELERLGALAPRALGGGGLKAGADFATRRAALEAGSEFAQQATGGAVAGLPIAFGSMVQEADQKPGGVTAKDALHAAALSPFYSALDAIEPAQFKGLLKRGLEGNIIKRVATAAFVGAAAEVPQEGIQTAMEQSFRPDLSTSDKMANIVDAAVSGGAIGAVFGGSAGIRALKRVDATSVSNEDLASSVDAMLQLPNFWQAQQTPPATNEQVAVEPDGVARKEISPFDFQRSEFDTPVAPRPYEGATTEELTKGLGAAQKAIDAGTASDNVLRFAEAAKEELQSRNGSSTTDAVASEPSRSGEPQAEATAGEPAGDGGTDSGAPAPATAWNSERDALLKGVSTRQRYTDVQSREDLTAAVRARLEGGSSAAGDFKLAERLGIDTNAAAAPVGTAPKSATDQTTKAAAATKPDEQFAAQWKDDVQKLGQRDKGARSIKPASEVDAQQKIYQALGKDTEIGDGLEKLAQKYGILDDEKRLTPLAVEIAKKEPIATETAVKAAVAQGYKGADASMFDRGVRASLGGEQITKFGNQRDFAAYTAGAKWAEEHNSVPQGALKKYEAARYTGAVTDDQVAAMNAPAQAPQGRTVSEEAKAKQSANIAIDSAVSPTTQASDLAQLKSMVRQGDVKGAMEGLKRVQAGESLFQQPETEQKPFKGETVTRGAPRTGESTVELQPTRAASRAGAEAAIRKHEVTQAVHAAHAEGAIDSKERIRLLAKINQGRVADVAAAIPTQFTGEKALRTTSLTQRTAQREAARQKLADLWQQVSEESDNPEELSVDRNGVLRAAKFQGDIHDEQARKVQEQLEGKTALQVTEMLVKGAPSEFHRVVAKKINEVMSYLTKAGMTFEFKVVRAGDIAPEVMTEARGLTHDDAENDITTVYINGIDGPGPTGLNYEVVMHEMLHAVTMQSIGYVQATGKFSSPLGRAVQDLQAVTDAVQAHLSNRERQGNLTKLEQFILSSNAAENPDEVLAWALSSPEFQSYLDTIDYTPRQTLWGRFVQAMRTFIGLGARGDGALVEVLRTAETIMSVGPQELELAALSGYREAMMRTPGVAPSMNERAQGAIKQVESAFKKVTTLQSLTERGLKHLVGWMPMTHITEQYKHVFPEVGLLQEAHAARRATTAVFAHLYNAPKLLAEKLSQTREGKAALTKISELMELTAWDIDYAKTWDQNDHLHSLDNQAQLQRLHAEGYRTYNALKGAGLNTLIDQYRSINEMEHFASMSLGIRQLVNGDPSVSSVISGFDTDPVENFRNNSALHDPEEARKYWRSVLNGQLAAVDDYIKTVRGSDDPKANARLSPLEHYSKEVKKGIQSMDNAPYFHLGRSGEHTVFGSVRLGEDKQVDPAAVDHVASELAKVGVTDARISRDLNKPQVFLRVDTPEERDLIAATMLRLQREGWLNKDIEVTRGVREQGEFLPERTRAEMNRFVNTLRADPMFEITSSMSDDEKKALEALKDRAVKTAYDVWLDMLPDAATSKVLTHRESKPGYSTNMARSFAFRYNIAVNSIASLSAEPQMNDAFQKMRGRLNDAKVATGQQDIDTITTLYNELSRREAQRPLASKADNYDTWRAWTHAFYLGMSPSYALVNLSQIGTLLWPELSKNHGFVKTARAFAKVTPIAFKILKVTMMQGYDAGGVLRASDGVITRQALEAALGTDKATTDFMMSMIGSGIIDIGSAARELATVAEGREDSASGKTLRFAAATGLYSETFTRLIAALSARELHANDDASTVDYAKHVVRESMLEYSTWNVARKMGKMGVAGEFTPVMASFMQYSTQVTWKLYRELSTAFLDRAANAAEKTEAKKFLVNHLVAMTAVAGTLGLPFATVIAAVVEKLVDLYDDDDEPFDASASWRNYMASIFGKDLGEVISRGAPRAAGFDLSQRTGEQDLLPFSQWLTDKRKYKDASSEAALRSLGAPVSMAGSIYEGFGKISDGNVMDGLVSMMPAAFRGPTKAFQMYEDGYKDANGNTLPMTPKSSAMLVQLIGLTPQAKAEYSEARGDQAAREGVLVNRAKVLRSGIADAVISDDHDAARDLIRQAKAFDTANPAFAVLPDIENAIKGRLKAQAIAQATQTPIGTSPKDKAGRQLTGYANIEFARQ